MSPQLQQLLDAQLPLPGVAAYAVRMPDFAVGQESFGDWFSADQIAQFLGRMIQTVENLRRHQIEPVRLCWVFEHARVHLAARPDGACLALFVEHRPDVPIAEISQILNGFLALPEL
jgi:hypothetical protein